MPLTRGSFGRAGYGSFEAYPTLRRDSGEEQAMITASCASCGESFLVGDETVGQQVTCPACAKPVVVQTPQEEGDEGPVADSAWEYVILSDFGRMGHVDEKKLNRMGRQGWELVSVFRESPASHTCFYFKRRLLA
jgi:hypothetical protein